MKGGYNAKLVMQDYKRKQAYKRKLQRQSCKDTKCTACKYQKVCEGEENE